MGQHWQSQVDLSLIDWAIGSKPQLPGAARFRNDVSQGDR